MNQPTSQPTQKVAAAGIGGAASVVIIWLIGLSGLNVPPEVAAALTTIGAFVAGYMKTEKAK